MTTPLGGVVVEALEDGGGAVGGVDAPSGVCDVRAFAAHGDVDRQDALAARLDARSRKAP